MYPYNDGPDFDPQPSVRTTRVRSDDPRLNILRGAAQRGFDRGESGHRTLPWPDGGYVTFINDDGEALWVGHHDHWMDAARAVEEANR